MKHRIFIIVLLLLLAISLFACDETPSDEDTQTTQSCTCDLCGDTNCKCGNACECKTQDNSFAVDVDILTVVDRDIESEATAYLNIKNNYIGKYGFSIDSALFEVYLDTQKLTAEVNNFVFTLSVGAHTVKIKNITGEKQHLSLKYDVEKQSIGKAEYEYGFGQKYITKLVPTDSEMYTLKSSKNEVIADVLEIKVNNGIDELTRLRMLDNFSNSTELDVFFAGNKDYYIITENIGDSQGECYIESSVLKNEIADGINISLTARNNYKYYKFTTKDISNSNYTFTFERPIDDSEIYSFRVMDTKGEMLFVDSVSYGVLNAYGLKQNTIYYIGIWSSHDRKTSVTIT